MITEPNVFCKKLCLKIKVERTIRGLSQEDLGELCGISNTSIGAIERGQSIPTILTIAKIAKAFNMSVSELTNISEITL